MPVLWEKQPEESAKSFAGFTAYRDLPPQERSLQKAATRAGRNSARQYEVWSKRHNWVERVAAYDAYRDSRQLVVQEAGLQEAVEVMTKALNLRLTAIEKAIDERIQALLEQSGNTNEIKQLLAALDKSDMLRRRSMGLPTAFKIENASEPNYGEATYYIGGAGE